MACLRRDLLMAEERTRRATEMTQEASNEADLAMKANRDLTAKVVDLQAGFQTLTDEEAAREPTALYHDMVHWSFSHFQKPLTPDDESPLESPRGEDILDLDTLRFELSQAIYQSFFRVYIVGEGQSGSNHLRDIESEIQRQCKCGSTSFYGF